MVVAGAGGCREGEERREVAGVWVEEEGGGWGEVGGVGAGWAGGG